MGIELPHGLRADEIRILQEFRRVGRGELSRAEIDAIRHPAGGGEEALKALITKGFIEGAGGEAYRLLGKGEELLRIDSVPLSERG